ncbi:unnamed protein product [Linum tenue]|uniref:Uncharacterized protein n=1 Tax=Linum tenue TaxID=586396 RepID=A0AAV0QG63_9ROSI|nr:unnamed protein product [Linum tenue]
MPWSGVSCWCQGGGWLSHTSAVLDLRVLLGFQAISL